MRQNKIEDSGKKGVLVALAVVFVAAVTVGVLAGYNKLRDIWQEQCVIDDIDVQVTVSSGKMVKADVLAENLGLRKGANLARIDFEAKRAEVLSRIPNLKSVSILRRLPDKVTVTAEERIPVARMNVVGRKGETGRVVDSEGMVFVWQRGTQMLPTIRETQPVTQVGSRLAGRSLAALRAVESSLEPDFSDLGVLEVDVSRPDYLTMTLGNYSTAKIAWEGMDAPTPSTKKNLDRQLSLLVRAVRSQVGDRTVIWNATDTSKPGRIYADSKGAF